MAGTPFKRSRRNVAHQNENLAPEENINCLCTQAQIKSLERLDFHATSDSHNNMAAIRVRKMRIRIGIQHGHGTKGLLKFCITARRDSTMAQLQKMVQQHTTQLGCSWCVDCLATEAGVVFPDDEVLSVRVPHHGIIFAQVTDFSPTLRDSTVQERLRMTFPSVSMPLVTNVTLWFTIVCMMLYFWVPMPRLGISKVMWLTCLAGAPLLSLYGSSFSGDRSEASGLPNRFGS